MRLIGTLATESDAARFGDYLLSISMPNHAELGRDGEWQIWIEHDDHQEQALSQLHAYRASPNDPKYATLAYAAARVRREAAMDAERRRKNHIDVRTSWCGLRTRPTPVAIAIVIFCIFVGALTGFSMAGNRAAAHQTEADERHERILEALRFQPISALINPATPELLRHDIGRGRPRTMFSSVADGQLWRLVTPAFLHGDLLHLAFNLMWVVSLGRMIEARKGSMFLLLFVIAAAVVSNAGEALWIVYEPGGNGFNGFGGFSGVNYALFGYAWIKGRFQPYELIGVNQQTVGLMLGWLVLCILQVIPNVANAAHVMGLVVGVAVGYAPTLRRKIGLQ